VRGRWLAKRSGVTHFYARLDEAYHDWLGEAALLQSHPTMPFLLVSAAVPTAVQYTLRVMARSQLGVTQSKSCKIGDLGRLWF